MSVDSRAYNSRRWPWVATDARDGRAFEPVMDDAIVEMSVPHRIPDRSELDAGARVHGASLLLTCDDGFAHFPPRAAREDDFFTMRTRIEQSSCASVQTFRASDAAEDLNRRLFLAGALISAAVALLLTAVGRQGSGTVSLRRS